MAPGMKVCLQQGIVEQRLRNHSLRSREGDQEFQGHWAFLLAGVHLKGRVSQRHPPRQVSKLDTWDTPTLLLIMYVYSQQPPDTPLLSTPLFYPIQNAQPLAAAPLQPCVCDGRGDAQANASPASDRLPLAQA
jgi:hypothetical protein